MDDCVRIEKCAFFTDKMDHMIPALAEVMKQNYCRGNWQSCARHALAEACGKDAVPLDMYPNQHERAKHLIEAMVPSS